MSLLKTPLLVMLLMLLGLTACGGDDPSASAVVAAADTRRNLPAGELLGSVNAAGAHQWLGIPFAQPPVGALRWRAPQAMSPWSGVREATERGKPCLQPVGFNPETEGVIENVLGDEDCLTLDIYAPPKSIEAANEGAGLPVMVWIHGGGNSMGDASPYDGSQLALSQNIIFVAIQYRLGPLGWFYHQDLHPADASSNDRSGNYGTLDTIAALQWVQQNISGFGGNPDNVTVFGESAGGVNVFALLASAQANGLFHRAIAQSGIANSVSINGATTVEKNASHTMADKLLTKHNLNTVAELRSLKGYELVSAYMATPEDMMLEMPTVIADGTVLPGSPLLEALQSGKYNQVPVMFGTNHDEFKLFMAQDPARVSRYFGFWMKQNDPQSYDRDAYYGSVQWRIAGAEAPARAIATPRYVYRFDWDNLGSPLWMDLPAIFGAAHAFEIPFVLGGVSLGPLTELVNNSGDEEGRLALSEAMMNYWGNFAHHGDPNKGKPVTTKWLPWQQENERFMVFDDAQSGGIRMSEDTVTLAELMAELAADERFEKPDARCGFFEELSGWSMAVRPYKSAVGC